MTSSPTRLSADSSVSPGSIASPARHKSPGAGFAEQFVGELAVDFATHGATVIAELRDRDPNAYLRICAAVLPKEVRPADPLDALNDEQLTARFEAIAARLADAGIYPRLASAGEPRGPQPAAGLPPVH